MNAEAKTFATHLLHFLACGEQIAVSCASNQAKLTSDKKMRRFFATQARQEKQHAFVFNAATRWLRPKRFQHISHHGLQAFEEKLSSAIQHHRLAESIVAQQLLFEGLGEITLEKVSQGIEDRGFGFQRVRKNILKQEKAHHHFGEKHFQNILNAPECDIQHITKECKEYLEILEQVLIEMQPVLEFYNQSPQSFYDQLVDELPSQLRADL